MNNIVPSTRETNQEMRIILISYRGILHFFDEAVKIFTDTHMNSCSFQVGAPAEAGEMAKDPCYDGNVTASEGVFYLLVVKLFRPWSVHSPEVSVRLRQNNDRMVLDRLLLVTKDCF